MTPFALLFFALVLTLSPITARAELRAGAAIVDITPTEWPLRLRGSFTPREVDSAHDPLNARALVLDDGTISLAMVVVDSCMVHRPELTKAKALAAEKTGIPTDRILVSATHTHSAPFANASYGTPQELAYQQRLINGIAESIVQAHDNLQTAELGYSGEDLPDEVYNRRWFMKPGTMPENPFGQTSDLVKMNPPRGPNIINPAGPTDPEVSILSVRNAKGQPLSLLANYPLHYVGNTASQVSADYFGEFSRLIGVRLRRSPQTGFVGMLSNGTSGDINNINFRVPRPPREPYEQIRIVASKAADSAYRAYRKTDHQRDVKLGMLQREVTLEIRIPTEEDITRAQGYIARHAAGDDTVPKLALIYARRVLEQINLGETTSVLLQVIKIGDLAIATIPFEVLVEIGLELKARSPFADTFVIELANGGFGYLPTRAQHAFGGYETWLATNKVEVDSAEIIVEELLAMMAELKK